MEVRLLDFPTSVPSPKKPNTHIVYVGIYYGRNDDWGEESFFLILPNPWYRLHARPEGSRCCPVLGEKSHKDWIGPSVLGWIAILTQVAKPKLCINIMVVVI